MQPEWHTAHPMLDMNPYSVRVNVQIATTLAFSLRANNLDSDQQ